MHPTSLTCHRFSRAAAAALTALSALVAFSITLTATSAHATPSSTSPVQVVTVRNAQLIPSKLLRAPHEVAEFHALWAKKQPNGKTTAQVQDWSYTIDIVTGAHVERWMYQSNGMTARVSDKIQPVMQLKSPAAFNSVIGAARY